MADVWYSPDETDQAQLMGLEDSVKSDRSGEDLLFQVLLDWGLDVTLPISVEKLGGHEVFSVDKDSLIACFDQALDLGLARLIALRSPLRAVFRDSGLDSDDARINLEQIFRQVSPSTEVRAI